jgi:hypothetical protein
MNDLNSVILEGRVQVSAVSGDYGTSIHIAHRRYIKNQETGDMEEISFSVEVIGRGKMESAMRELKPENVIRVVGRIGRASGQLCVFADCMEVKGQRSA